MNLMITVCDVTSGCHCFGLSKGGEIPWYVFEVLMIVIGCESSTMLADIPQASTYINTYDARETTMDVLVINLMKGPSAFQGTEPIDSFYGLFNAHL